MKKLLVIPLLVLFLAGCGKKTALETISDIEDVSVIASAQRIQIQLPPELSSPTMESEENGALYLCDDYSVTV